MQDTTNIDDVALATAERILAISVEGPYRPGRTTRFKVAIQCAVRDALEAYRPAPRLGLGSVTVQSALGKTLRQAADVFKTGHGFQQAVLAAADELDRQAAQPQPVSGVPAGFKGEDLQDILDGMDNEPKTIDVGVAHIESTSGYLCRLLRALLASPALPAVEQAPSLTDAAKQNMELVLARLEQIIDAAESADCDLMEESAKEALPCARAVLASLSDAAPARKEG